MKRFSQLNENLDSYQLKSKADKVIKLVEEKIKSSFSRGVPKIEFTVSSNDGELSGHYHFRLEVKDIMIPIEWDRLGKRLLKEVQELFTRVDDQNLDPLLSAGESTDDGETITVLSFGEIDFENSEIVKSLKTINKYDL